MFSTDRYSVQRRLSSREFCHEVLQVIADRGGACSTRKKNTYYQDVLQIAPNNREVLLIVSVVYAAMPKRLWMNVRCATTSPFCSQRICPFRIRCIAS